MTVTPAVSSSCMVSVTPATVSPAAVVAPSTSVSPSSSKSSSVICTFAVAEVAPTGMLNITGRV